MPYNLLSTPQDVGTQVYLFPEPVALVSAARTAVGRRGGHLRAYTAVELGVQAVSAAVSRSGLAPQQVERLVMGNVVGAGLGEAAAKQVAVGAGLKPQTLAKMVNLVCASAMEAVVDVASAIERGFIEAGIAGGMESVTHAPYLLGPFDQEQRPVAAGLAGYRMLRVSDELPQQIQRRRVLLKEATRHDGLFWPPEAKFMGQYAALTMKRAGVDLEQVNFWASQSHQRAREAWEHGRFAAEVCGPQTDEILDARAAQALLKEERDQWVSAYNSAVPADGAAALLLASPALVQREGLEPLGWLVGYAAGACAAEHFLEAPVHVTRALLDALEAAGNRAPLRLVEINEAFALQLGLFEEWFPQAGVNINGGAVAMGHPLGAGGARILVTLLHALRSLEEEGLGIATICYGGGGAYALAVRRS